MRPARVMRKTLLGFFLFTLGHTSLIAYAVKDWNLSTEIDPMLQVPACRAWTDVSSGDAPLILMMSFSQDGQSLPFISISGFSLHTAPTELSVKVSPKESQVLYLLKPSRVEGEASLYWYAPTDQVRLTDLIAGANNLEVWWFENDGKPKKSLVSLRGSFATLAETLKCTGQKELQPREFLETLNAKLEGLVPAETASAEQAFKQSQVAYRNFAEFKIADRKYKDADQALSSINQGLNLAQNALLVSEKQLEQLRSEQNQKTTELASLKNSIPLLTANVESAKSAYSQAQVRLKDAESKYNPVKSQVASRRQEVETLQSQVQRVGRGLEQNRNDLQVQESQVIFGLQRIANLERDIDHTRQKLEHLRQKKSEAEQELHRYSVSEEKQKILRQDSNYQDLKQRLPRLQDKVERLGSEVREIKQALSTARERLKKCQEAAKPGKSELVLTGSEGRKGCQVERQAVERLKQEESKVEGNLNQARQDLNQVTTKIKDKEQNAQRRAEQGRQNLAENLRRVEREIDEAKRQVSAYQADIQQIRFSVESARFRIQSLRSEILSLERDLAVAKRSLLDAQARLERFIRESNYEGLRQLYQQAANEVEKTRIVARRAQDDLQKAQGWIVTIEMRLQDLLHLIPTQEQEVTGKMAQVESLRAQQTQASLTQAKLKDLRDRAFGVFDQDRKLYRSLILKLQLKDEAVISAQDSSDGSAVQSVSQEL